MLAPQPSNVELEHMSTFRVLSPIWNERGEWKGKREEEGVGPEKWVLVG